MLLFTESNTAVNDNGENTAASPVFFRLVMQGRILSQPGRSVWIRRSCVHLVCGTTEEGRTTKYPAEVGWPNTAQQKTSCGSREEPVPAPVLAGLPCKVISKRKHSLYTETGGTMETKLARISQLSSENPDMVFTSIGHQQA